MPADARLRSGRWALAWAAWMAIAAGEAALLWLGLGRRPGAFTSALVVYGSSASLWIATAPFVIACARTLRWPGADRPQRAALVVAAHFAGAVAVAAIQAWWLRYAWMAFSPRVIQQPYAVTFFARLDLHLFAWLAIVGAVWARDHWERVRAAGLDAARVRGEIVRTRLHVLTMQLQPHFLFNTLHGISELVHRDAAAARRTARHLRDLLRQSFAHAASAEVPLREELRFLDSYLGIQRTRVGAGLDASIAVPAELLDARVPCLVLQPLVENAIRHGLAPRGAGRIEISASRTGDALELRVRDDGRGLTGPRRERQGTGNTRLRLAQLYGGAHRFELRPAQGGGAEAVVTIPLRTDAAERARPEPVDPTSEPQRTGRLLGVVAAVWAFWATFWIVQSIALAAAGARQPALPEMLWFNAVNAILWGLATLPIVAAVRRWPARGSHPLGRIAPHVAIALVAAAALAVVRWRLFFAPQPLVAPILSGWWAWDMTTYVVVAAFAQAAFLAERRRAQGVRLASLETDLAIGQLDAIDWELRPDELVRSLDAIADAAETDPERADELTTALGDLLREMLVRIAPAEPVTPEATLAAPRQRVEVSA